MASGDDKMRDRSPIDRRDYHNDRKGGGRGMDRDRGRRSGGGLPKNSSRRAPPERRIFVSNIPFEMKWQEVKDMFRDQVGDVTYVELFNDEDEKPRGCGILEFATEELAKAAVEKMHRYELKGRKLVVKEDFDTDRDKHGRIISGSGRRADHYRGGGDLRDNLDNRDRGASNPGLGGSNFGNNTYGLSPQFLDSLGIDGPLHNRLFVANLAYSVDEKKLREVFRLAGRVVTAELNRDKEAKSRGHAVVEYDHPVEAVQAISMFNNQMLYDRKMTVRFDKQPGPTPEELSQLPKTLPEGLGGVGMGLGSGGNPLTDVAKNLPSANNQQQQQQLGGLQNAIQQQVGPQLGGGNLAAGAGFSELNTLAALAKQMSSNNLLAALAGTMGAGGAANNPMGGGMQGNMGGMGGNAMSGGMGANTNMAGGMGSMSGNSLAGLGGGMPNSMSGNNGMSGAGGGNPNMGGNSGMGNPNLGGGMGSGMVGSSSTGGSGGGIGDMSRGSGGYSSGSSSYGNMSVAPNSGRGLEMSALSGGSSATRSDTIVIRNLPPDCNWQILREGFAHCGDIKYAEMKERGTGLIRFNSERDAERAVSMMDKQNIANRPIDVRLY